MSFLERLIGGGRKTDSASDLKNKRWLEGNQSYEQSKLHYIHQRPLEAIKTANHALLCGFENAELFSIRGSAYQQLEWHDDAIEDFDKLISLEPNDCNNYFMRAMAKSSIGDQPGYLADVEESIRLAQIDSPETRFHNAGAKELGHDNAATVYRFQLQMAKDMPDFVIQKRKAEAEKKGRMPK